jgi:hypothetical protein
MQVVPDNAAVIRAADAATVRTIWLQNASLDRINEVGSVSGLSWTVTQPGTYDTLTTWVSFISGRQSTLAGLATSSTLVHDEPFHNVQVSQHGIDYRTFDLDNHGGAVGDQINYDSSPNNFSPLYLGSAPRRYGDDNFKPKALNDDDLIIGGGGPFGGEVKLWDPAVGAFQVFEALDGEGNSAMRITERSSLAADARTFIVAGNHLIIRTMVDAEGTESPSPIYSLFDVSELMPENSPYFDVSLISAANNGSLIASAKLDGPDEHTLLLPRAGLIPDYNHDGKIDDKDRGQVTADNPYRFWINDDNDDGNTEGDDIPQGAGNGSADVNVNGTRDLVDFFPVYLNIRPLLEALTATNMITR